MKFGDDFQQLLQAQYNEKTGVDFFLSILTASRISDFHNSFLVSIAVLDEEDFALVVKMLYFVVKIPSERNRDECVKHVHFYFILLILISNKQSLLNYNDTYNISTNPLILYRFIFPTFPTWKLNYHFLL